MAIGRRRATAVGSAVFVLVGAILVTVAGSSVPATAYLSEAGVGPSAVPYRLGILALAVGLLFLAVSVRFGPAASLLAAGGGFAALSGAVPCTAGCPLPPYEPATVRDLVHGGASIAAVAACVFAMVAVALAVPPVAASPGPPPDASPGPPPASSAAAAARVSLVAAAVALPLSALIGLAMIATGRGALVGVTERVLLVVTAAWACYLAVSRVFAAGPGVDAEAPRRS